MSELPFKLTLPNRESAKPEDWTLSDFSNSLHIHSQYQLTYIVNGCGILFHGNYADMFENGDVFIIASNVPHVFMPYVHSDNTKEQLEAVTILFNLDYPSHIYKSIDEALPILKMFDRSFDTIKAGEKRKKEVIDNINEMKDVKDGFERILRLLDIFHIMSCDFKPLSSKNTKLIFSADRDVSRIEKVYEYSIKNYRGRVDLSDVASLSNMTDTAFCRFYKKITGKSYMTFLIEVRVGMACWNMLIDDCNLSVISARVGFKSVTNFIKQFTKVMGVTPLDYRQMLRKNMRIS